MKGVENFIKLISLDKRIEGHEKKKQVLFFVKGLTTAHTGRKNGKINCELCPLIVMPFIIFFFYSSYPSD
jgi:hypothetical protein